MKDTLRVLVVDDDVTTRRAIVRSLRLGESTLDIQECGEGSEALRLLSEGIDCVFLDYLLPGQDGLSILRAARNAGIRTPIIILTGQGDERLAVEAMKAGATDYLAKSRISAETLCQSLRYALRLYDAERAAAAAQERLRKNEERLNRIVETMADGLLILDSGGRYTFANPAAEQILGATARQIIGQSYTSPPWVRLRADGLPLALQEHPFPQIMRDGQAVSRMELAVQRLDGQVIVILLSATPLRDRFGNTEGVVITVRDITASKRAEQALRESEERFSKVFHAAPTGIIVSTLNEDRIIDVNERFLAMSGYTQDELIGLTTTDMGAWIDPHQRLQALEMLGRGRFPFTHEGRIRTKAGDYLDVLVSVERIELQGEACLVAMFHDITQRKAAEEALRQSEKKYRSIFENAVIGIFHSTPEGRLLNVNPAYARMLGYTSPEEAIRCIGDVSRDLYVQPERRKAIIREVIEGTGVVRTENQYRRRDGSIMIGNLAVWAVRDNTGNLLCLEGFVEDISERKRIEAALRESNDQLESLIKGSPLAICAVDTHEKVTVWNPAAERVFGWTEAQVLGHPLPFVPDEKREEYQTLYNQILQGNGFTGVELQRRRKDGSIADISLSTAPLRDAHGHIVGAIGLMADITEAKRLKEQLLAAHRMETVGRLAGGIAHDFNNLLAVISGYSEAMMRRLNSGDPLRSHVSEIEKAADRGASLTRQLLAFSRRQAIELRVLDLNKVVTSVYQMLRRVISDKIEIRLCTSARPMWVKADPGQMEQVLVNLALNARDAMPEGGKLTLATTHVQLTPTASHGYNLPSGDYVKLDVQDTGCGMDEEVRSRIFDPFFTTKAGKGTGLGLSIVYGIVQQSGGGIFAHSELGKGSRFDVLLPRAADPDESPYTGQ